MPHREERLALLMQAATACRDDDLAHGRAVQISRKDVVAFMRSIGFDVTTWLGQVDHIVPLWEGGEDVDSNRQILCQNCHREKCREEAARKSRAPRKIFRPDRSQ